MSLALQCLVGLTLLVCGGAAALPEIWQERQPQARATPGGAVGRTRWVVRAPGDRWFLDGEPISRPRLAAALSGSAPGGETQLLPSSTLPMGEVAESLAWLRQQSSGPVLLALPPEKP